MSTNHKIRQIAERLPLVPKLHNGRPQPDSRGHLVLMNHFREIKKIYKEFGNRPAMRDHLCGKYVEACWETHFMYKDIVARQERERKLVLWCKIILWVSLLATIVKFITDNQ